MAHTIADVERIIRSLLATYFAEHALPMPAIKLVNQQRSRSLATCGWIPEAPNTTITVQKAVLEDERTLTRVLAHELIHHWDFLRNDQSRAIRMAQMRRRPSGTGHGREFKEYAARINAIAGNDYVTETSDQDYIKAAAPPYYILVQPHRGGDTYGFTVAIRPSAAQKAEIELRKQKELAKLFKITDSRFLHGAPIKRYGGYSLSRSDADTDFLRSLYLSGKAL